MTNNLVSDIVTGIVIAWFIIKGLERLGKFLEKWRP
jgi:hypothetical protein